MFIDIGKLHHNSNDGINNKCSFESTMHKREVGEAAHYTGDENEYSPSASGNQLYNTVCGDETKNEYIKRISIPAKVNETEPSASHSEQDHQQESSSFKENHSSDTQIIESKPKAISDAQHARIDETIAQPPKCFMKPKNERDVIKTFKYALEVVMWSFYHSSLLNVLPIVLSVCLFGCTWGFDVNNGSMLVHYLTVMNLLLIALYATVIHVWIYVFGKAVAMKLLYRISVPLCMSDVLMTIIKEVIRLPIIGLINYVIFLSHSCLLLRFTRSKNSKVSSTTCSHMNRYEILCSDGTPVIFFKCYMAFLIPYFIMSDYLLPYMADANFLSKLIGRLVIAPFLFFLSDSYMNSLVLKKSDGLMKYRMVAGNIMTFAALPILRLMITNSGSVENTILLAACSSIFDIFLRLTYLPRKVYYMKLSDYFKNICVPCPVRAKVHNLEQQPPFSEKQTSSPLEVSNKNAKKDEILMSKKGFSELMASLNLSDELTKSIIDFHINRSVFNSMGELQLAIYSPLILYLCYPIRRYMTFNTFSSADQMLISICIQLPIEFFTQTVSVALENYLYGIELPLEKSWNYYANHRAILHFALVILSSFYLSLSPYQIETENWPDD